MNDLETAFRVTGAAPLASLASRGLWDPSACWIVCLSGDLYASSCLCVRMSVCVRVCGCGRVCVCDDVFVCVCLCVPMFAGMLMELYFSRGH